MPISPSSSAQEARENVARRLRDLRKDAGLTVVELAVQCGWHHAKTSRIENARTPPSTTDIRLWCRTCSAPDQVADLIAASRHAESLYTEWRRRVRTGLRQLQDSYVQLYRSTRTFRVYSPTLVPGFLQTEGYARALLSTNARFLDVPDDGPEAAVARLERSQIIHESGHHFLLLIEEAVLRYQLGDAEAMAAQLGQLLTAGALLGRIARRHTDGNAGTSAVAAGDVQRVRRHPGLRRTALGAGEYHAAVRDRPVPQGI